MENGLSEFGRLLVWLGVGCVALVVVGLLTRRWIGVSPHAFAVLSVVAGLCALGVILDLTLL